MNNDLDKFCGSEFWNANVTWYTDDPDFTKCFERTVLVWVPCLCLWIFSSLEVLYILNSKKERISWNFLNISKLLINCVIIVLTLCDFGVVINRIVKEDIVYNVDLYTPIIKVLTFILAAFLLNYNRKHGLVTSGLLFQFWLLCALCGGPQFRTEIRQAQVTTPDPYYDYISYVIYYPLVLLIFLLNCFADKPPEESKQRIGDNPCPELQSGFLSKIFYSWFNSFVWKGYRKPLEIKDLWDMNADNSSKEVASIYNKHWRKIVRKFHGAQFTQQSNETFKSDPTKVDFVTDKTRKQASILPALIKTFGSMFLFGTLMKFIQDILTFVSPQILRALIAFVENQEEQWKGFLYAGLLFATAAMQTLVLSQYFQRMFIVGMRIRTAVVTTIYRKALRMSNAAKKENTVGEIVNLMSVDAQKFIELMTYLNLVWSAPLQIILALYFLWDMLGPSVLAGLAIMIVLIPINGYIANRVKVLQVMQMKNKDDRVKMMNEVLSGIKVLKLYAWEPSFEAQVLKIRAKEMKVLKQSAYLNGGTSFIWACAPFLVALVSFGTYVLIDENNVLDATKTFVSLSLFNILRFPLSMLPALVSNMVQCWVSIQRINKFINCDEMDPNNVSHDPSELDPLIIENGNFHWEGEATLKNINLRMHKNTLTAIVGRVGSGKSSLISAFLGEMVKTSGRVNIVGSVAYVSQQAWIQNATMQDNILFGKPLNRKLYERVVEACALKPDIDILPGGDQTEIGEKGINLSGGQKQRVSLARAVYADADIYFLDDPLSAVDSHVGKHIFEQVIGSAGILKNKTRVLVTHGITYLPQTDKIVVVKDGKVSEMGTYQELLDRKGAFSDFLMEHITEADEENQEELDELKNQLSGAQGTEELVRKLETQLSRTRTSSETGSDKAINGFQHQNSMEKDNRRKRSSSTEIDQQIVPEGQKLIELEKTQTGNVKWEVYKHYLKSIGTLFAFCTLFFNIVFQGFSIGSNIWLTMWSSDTEIVVNGTTNTAKRDTYLGVYGALGIGQAIGTVFANVALKLGCWHAARVLHITMLHGILRGPLHFFDVTPQGRILARFSKDMDEIDTGLPIKFYEGIYCLFEVLGTLVIISYATPTFMVVIIPIAILYFFIQRFYVATSRQLKRLESVSRSPIYSHFGETVTGAQVIRAFGEQNRFIKESESRVDFNQICYYPSIMANRWLAVRLEMVGNLIIFFAALFAVFSRGQNSGNVGLSVSYALQITQILNWVVRMASDIETNIVAVERIKEYGETEQEASWHIPNTHPKDSWPDNGAVVFKDYAVCYRKGLDLVLKNVNFSVKGGEKVGIVGRTGAGKSSLTLALFRIIEASHGQIFIDGVNISELGLHELRLKLTIIPQDAVLFSGTLRMNLDPFNTHSDKDIWGALEHAHLKSFVEGLPAGLNHEVAEGGENLSVGQRQLICLSRALLRKTKVLILDEATAAVDLETDDLIQKTIKTEFKDCTVLTIAHRLNTIMDSDRVLVLDRGNIVEFDSPSSLLANRDSIFYSMCKDAGLV